MKYLLVMFIIYPSGEQVTEIRTHNTIEMCQGEAEYISNHFPEEFKKYYDCIPQSVLEE